MESDPPALETLWVEQLLQQTTDLALIQISPSGVINAWTGAASLVFGWTRSQAVGQPFGFIFSEKDRATGADVAELALAAMKGRSEDDRWHLRCDGSRFWGSGVTQAIRDDAGTLLYFSKMVRDRTDLRTQIKSLENRLGRHEALEAARGRLAGHAQAPVLGTAPFEAQAALREALAPFEAAARRHGQSLQLIVPPGPLTIEGDELKFIDLTARLVGNALHHAVGGSVVVSLSIEGRSAVVRVEDDGSGLDSDTMRKAVALFTRADTSEPVPIGFESLAAADEIARAHGGNIEARSRGAGQGAVFAARLPLTPEAGNDWGQSQTGS